MRTWHLLLLGIAGGLAVGLGAYTFVYAKGASYLTNDPAACANCHVMQEHYARWTASPHRSVAVCNDCHAPHDVIGKYSTKALNGFWHSFAFTTGRFPQAIQITPRNRAIAEDACRTCHTPLTHAIDTATSPTPLSCLSCHQHVGHR